MKKSNKKEAVKVRKKANKKKTKKRLNKTLRAEERLKRIKTRKISKIKQEYLDIDYMSQLNHEEQLWMANFLCEELNAEIPKQKEFKKTSLQKTKADVKRISDANNDRNIDVQGLMKAQGRLMFLSNENMSTHFDSQKNNKSNTTEDALIDLIDKKREGFNPDED